MNPLSTAYTPSAPTRFRHLGLALLNFYLLYNVTTLYSVSLYKIAPSAIHHLATPFDSIIPFIPAMIVPYSWSLVLFVASFFLVRTSRQLSLLTYRLILATTFACLIFYLYPARFSFHRVIPDDWTQFGYQFLQLVDKPFNQLPSLHVTYAVVLGVSLWDLLASKKYWVAVLYHVSLTTICALIVASTVLTYQHHLMDVLGGIVLAVVVLALSNRIRNGLVTKYLALGVIGFLLVAIAGFYLVNMSMMAFDSIETLAIFIASYWLISFVMLAWVYQQTKLEGSIRWFKKSSEGKLTTATWIKFAPIIIIYNSMSFFGEWYFKVFLKSQKYSLTPYAMNDTVKVVASPRLRQDDLHSHLRYWLFGCHSLEQSCLASYQTAPYQTARYQVIVVDLAAEISSHVDCLEVIAKDIINAPVHYVYLPLLDLQPLNEVSLQEYIDLFEQIDVLTQSADLRAINADNENQQESSVITLINFHCVMGLSRSIGVQVLYLLYCGTLTIHNYRSWLEQHYPQAHIKDAYLPQSLVEAITNYKSAEDPTTR